MPTTEAQSGHRKFGPGFWIPLVGIVITVFLLFPAYNGISHRSEVTRHVNQVKQLMLACFAYAKDHEDRFPSRLEDIYPDYMDLEELLYGVGEDGQKLNMIYYPGQRPSRYLNHNQTPLIEYPVLVEGKRVIGYTDGYVHYQKEPW